jgi:hypothetical protein
MKTCCLLLLLLLVPAVRAAQPTPLPASAAGSVSGPVTQHVVDLGPAQLGCLEVYDNSATFTGFYYSEQNGAEAIDDLHMLELGGLCSFTFGYNKPGGGGFDAFVTFYANETGDTPPSVVLAGPYPINGLPGGANAITVNIEDGPFLGNNVWMGVSFSDPTAGLLVYDPPVIGSSDDYFYEFPANSYLFFGGDPVANFYLRVSLELATPVEPSSWGSVKTRHR